MDRPDHNAPGPELSVPGVVVSSQENAIILAKEGTSKQLSPEIEGLGSMSDAQVEQHREEALTIYAQVEELKTSDELAALLEVTRIEHRQAVGVLIGTASVIDTVAIGKQEQLHPCITSKLDWIQLSHDLTRQVLHRNTITQHAIAVRYAALQLEAELEDKQRTQTESGSLA